MKMLTVLLIVFFVSLSESVENKAVLEREVGFIEAELSLAKKKGIYYVVDLDRLHFLIKTRGIVLRQFPISGARIWGGMPSLNPLTLVNKSSLFKPKQKEIKPPKQGQKKESTYEPAVVEVDDMPVSFTLNFNENTKVVVRPVRNGYSMMTGWFTSSTRWYIVNPLATLWYSMRDRNYRIIELTMDEDDGRALYWTLPELSQIIILSGVKTSVK